MSFDVTTLALAKSYTNQYGGGGGSVPKPLTYDYMPEGYPTKSVQTTTLMEEQELEFSLMEDPIYMAMLQSPLEIVVGQTYTVKWDGTEYECVCVAVGPQSVLGNISIAGEGSDTGEPFLYVYNTEQHSGLFATLDTAASHTISVKTAEEVITPMAEEFMPSSIGEAIDAVGAVANTAKTTADNARSTANTAKATAEAAQTTAKAAQTTAKAAQSTANTAKATAEAAQTTAENAKIDPNQYSYFSGLCSKKGGMLGWYMVTPRLEYNDKTGKFYKSLWETEALNYNSMVSNCFIVDKYWSTDWARNIKGVCYLTAIMSGTSGLEKWLVSGVAFFDDGSIRIVKSNAIPVDAGEGIFLSFTVPYSLYMSSSTEGSTKQFRITVDDSGTLKATEVTST